MNRMQQTQIRSLNLFTLEMQFEPRSTNEPYYEVEMLPTPYAASLIFKIWFFFNFFNFFLIFLIFLFF